MIWIEIIGISLAFVIFKLWGNSYESWHGMRDNKEFRKEDKLKRPLWGVLFAIHYSVNTHSKSFCSFSRTWIVCK